MKASFVVPTAGYHKIRAASSDPPSVRVYKDRVRLNTVLRGDEVTHLAHEWIGPLSEGDVIEAEGETLTLTVVPHDPHVREETRTRPVTALEVNATEEVTIHDRVS